METKNENVFVVFETYMVEGDIQTQIAGVARTMERAKVVMKEWAKHAKEMLLEKFADNKIIVKERPTSIYMNVDFDDYYSFIQIVEKRITE